MVAQVVVTVQVLRGGSLVALDFHVHDWVEGHGHPALRTFMYGVALLGGRWLLVPPLGVAMLLRCYRSRSWQPLLYTAAGVLAMIGAVLLAKLAIGRSAPGSGVSEVFAGGLSYPSGHTVNVIVLGWLLVRLLTAGRAHRWLPVAAGCVVAAAALMSASVVYLDYHWLSDVFVAWALGVLLVLVVDHFAPRPPPLGEERAERRRQPAAQPA